MIDIARNREFRVRELLPQHSYRGERQYGVAQAAGMKEEYLHYSMIIVSALLRFAMLT
jgi:hypothetical protein